MKHFINFTSYRKAWNKASQGIESFIPLNIDIELSNLCNLSCPFCFLSDKNYIKSKKKSSKFMQFNLFQEIIKQCSELNIPSIKLNWMGEPTLYPMFNYCLDIIDKKRFFWDVIINTNGNYTKERNIGLLKTTKVIFSIDSFNKKTYEKMRLGGNLKKVLENINNLLFLGHKNIVGRRVITKDNQTENFKKDAYWHFGNKIAISEHYVFDRNKNNKLQVNYPIELERVYCGYPSQRLVIDTDGNVFPCCVDVYKEMNLGNIKKQSFLEIWKGEKLKKIREMLKKNKMPSKACKHCQSWASFKSPYSEAIKT